MPVTGKRLSPFSRKGAVGKAYKGASASETRPSTMPKKRPDLPTQAKAHGVRGTVPMMKKGRSK